MIIDSIELGQIMRLFDPFAAALVASSILAWPIYRFLNRIGSRQTVSEYVPEHQKKQGTPTMGGLIILAGLLAAQIQLTRTGNPSLAFAAVATIGFALIGFFDDFVIPRTDSSKRGLGWIPKLALQVLAASIVPAMTLGIDSPMAVWLAAAEVFVLLFFVNAFNFSDGMDGLAGGLLLILAGSATVMGLASGAILTAAMGAALVGAVIPFLFLNAPPAKVFMGDVGSMPIGAMLGWMAMDLYFRIDAASGSGFVAIACIGIWSLVLVAELVPVPIQILAVKLLKRRVFPRTPIHHAFEMKGVPETRTVWHFHLVQLVAALLATFLAIGAIAGNKP